MPTVMLFGGKENIQWYCIFIYGLARSCYSFIMSRVLWKLLFMSGLGLKLSIQLKTVHPWCLVAVSGSVVKGERC